MTRVILDPYSSFRSESFTANVVEMGIKEFGDDGVPKAYIEFDDGGAPITYILEAKGKSLVESGDNGRAKIKNFGVGGFAEQAKKLGYQTFIDNDPDFYEFGTIPDITGQATTWEAKKGGDRIDADGNKKEGFTNFTLVGIGGKKAVTQPEQPQQKKTEQPSAQKLSKDGVLNEPTLARWEEVLNTILTAPMTIGEIQKEINKQFKDESTTLAKTRTAALKALKESNKIILDENQKYSLV